MAKAEFNSTGTTLHLDSDEADRLKMVLAHVDTLGDYDTFSVFSALVPTLSESIEILDERSKVTVTTKPGFNATLVKFTKE